MRYVSGKSSRALLGLVAASSLYACAPQEKAQVVFNFQSENTHQALNADSTLPTDQCYVLHVIGSDFAAMFPKSQDPDAGVCDATTEASGIGNWYGLFAKGATASIAVPKGIDRYFHLIGIPQGTLVAPGVIIPTDCSGDFRILPNPTSSDDPIMQYRPVGAASWVTLDGDNGPNLTIFATGKADISSGTNVVNMVAVDSFDGNTFGRDYEACDSDHDTSELRSLANIQTNDHFSGGNTPAPFHQVTLNWAVPGYDTDRETLESVFYSVQPYASEASASTTPDYCADTATNHSIVNSITTSQGQPNATGQQIFTQTTGASPANFQPNQGYEIRVCARYTDLQSGGLHRTPGVVHRFMTFPNCDFVGKRSDFSGSDQDFQNYFNTNANDTNNDSVVTFCMDNDTNTNIYSETNGALNIPFNKKVYLIGNPDPNHIPVITMTGTTSIGINVSAATSGGIFAMANFSFQPNSGSGQALHLIQNSLNEGKVPFLSNLGFNLTLSNSPQGIVLEGNVHVGRLDNVMMSLGPTATAGLLLEDNGGHSPTVDQIRSLSVTQDLSGNTAADTTGVGAVVLKNQSVVTDFRDFNFITSDGGVAETGTGSGVVMLDQAKIGLMEDGMFNLQGVGFGIHLVGTSLTFPAKIATISRVNFNVSAEHSPSIYNRFGNIGLISGSNFSNGGVGSHGVVLDQGSSLGGMIGTRFEHHGVDMTPQTIALMVQGNGIASGHYTGTYSNNALCSETPNYGWMAALGDGDWMASSAADVTPPFNSVLPESGVGSKTLASTQVALEAAFSKQYGGVCTNN